MVYKIVQPVYLFLSNIYLKFIKHNKHKSHPAVCNTQEATLFHFFFTFVHEWLMASWSNRTALSVLFDLIIQNLFNFM